MNMVRIAAIATLVALLQGCGLLLSFCGTPPLAVDDAAPHDTGIPADWMFLDFSGRLSMELRNPTDEVLHEFPVPIRISASDILDELRSDLADLRFVVDGDETPLAHEIDTSEIDELLVWVKVPTLATVTTTHLWLYYGNPGAAPSVHATTVWSDGFRGVWHLGGVTADNVVPDSTTEHNDATMPTSHAVGSGLLGQARRFDGEVDVLVPDRASLHLIDDDMVTLEGWAKPDTIEQVNRGIIRKNNSYLLSAMRSFENCVDNYCAQMIVHIDVTDGTRDRGVSATAPLATDHFGYVVGTYSAADRVLRIYLDGALSKEVVVELDAGSPGLFTTTEDLFLGYSFLGWLDEIRVAAVRRSHAWIAAQHAAVMGDLVGYGAHQQIREVP